MMHLKLLEKQEQTTKQQMKRNNRSKKTKPKKLYKQSMKQKVGSWE
jgi:hypothetical protein